LALNDITIYSKDNGTGYPGDMTYNVQTATTIPTILAGEPVYHGLGSAVVVALASGTGAIAWPHIGDALGSTNNSYMAGVATTTSTENSTGGSMTTSGQGSVSVTPIDEPITYLISTLLTATYFGGLQTGQYVCPTAQQAYDAMVGQRVTFARTAGVGAQMLGGTYTINATDGTGNGLVVEALDVLKFPGKVRFSFRGALSYRSN